MEKEIVFFKYSSKSICVSGNGIDEISEKLKALGGRKNRSLTDPETKEKFTGFIFSMKVKEQLEELLGMALIDVEIEDKPKKEYKKEEYTKEDVSDDDIDFYVYSDKSFVVGGKTKPFKEDLSEMGGSWNKYIKGWIFSMKRLEEVEDYLEMEVSLTKPE